MPDYEDDGEESEAVVLDCPHCGAPVEVEGSVTSCTECDFVWDTECPW